MADVIEITTDGEWIYIKNDTSDYWVRRSSVSGLNFDPFARIAYIHTNTGKMLKFIYKNKEEYEYHKDKLVATFIGRRYDERAIL